MGIHICKNPDCKNYNRQLVDDLDHDQDCFWCSECGKTSDIIEIENYEANVWKGLFEDTIISRDYWKDRTERLEDKILSLIEKL